MSCAFSRRAGLPEWAHCFRLDPSQRWGDRRGTDGTRPRPNGFTLIEVLVALVAGSFVLVSLSWTLSILSRQLAEGARDPRERQFAAAAPVIQAMLEQAQPPSRTEARFSASAQGLSAIVPPPLAAGPVGPARLALEVRQSREGESLYATLTPADGEAGFPAAARSDRMLLGGYSRIGFDYVEDIRPDGVPRLPKLITITLTDEEGRIRKIVAEPRLDSDGSCRFDPISMTCRY